MYYHQINSEKPTRKSFLFTKVSFPVQILYFFILYLMFFSINLYSRNIFGNHLFIDSELIYSIMKDIEINGYRLTRITGESFDNTAFVFCSVGLCRFRLQDLGLLFFTFSFISLILLTLDAYKSHFFFILLVLFLIPYTIFLGQPSKEHIVLLFITLGYFLARKKRILNLFLLLFLGLIFTLLFRIYWIIIIFMAILSFLIGKIHSRYRWIVYLGIIIILSYLYHSQNNFFLSDNRIRINEGRMGFEVKSQIFNIFLNTSLHFDILNLVFNFFRFLFPVLFFNLSSPTIFLFSVFYTFINLLIFFLVRKNYIKLSFPDILILTFLNSFAFTQGIFEPDLGSTLKHNAPFIPMILTLISRLSIHSFRNLIKYEIH